jgi:sodium-dependent dicarboxylate transporter 2/3/5
LRVVGVAIWMATWWINEVLPVAATALLPVVLFPVLGIAPLRDATAPYADPVVFLFLGGFILGSATRRWALHRRIGLHIIAAVGTSPGRLAAGLMLASGFLSMWVSNTATAIMMLPIAILVLTLFEHRFADSRSSENLGVLLMLSVSYGASIGGIATLIGTPPNALLAGFLARKYGIQIGFGQWMMVGLPVSTTILLAAWLVLTRLQPGSACRHGGHERRHRPRPARSRSNHAGGNTRGLCPGGGGPWLDVPATAVVSHSGAA